MIKSFSEFVDRCRRMLPIFEELGEDWLEVQHRDNDTFKLDLKNHRARSREALNLIKHYNHSIASMIELGLTLRALLGGPKLVKISAEQAEIFENTDVRIRLSEYAQPFPVMVVEFPGRNFGIIWHGVEFLIMGVYFENYICYTRVLGRSKDVMIEDELEEELKAMDGSLDLSDEENQEFKKLQRIMINTCLMLMHLGCKKMGPTNPSHRDRLIRRGYHREAKAVPILYSFEQEVKIRVINQNSVNCPTHPGGMKSVHWRRGHWRMQKYKEGPKRIYISPILVNKHLFQGKMSDAKYQILRAT